MPMVDERIVNMQFNNAEFERNAKQSINTLDKLKQALHLDAAAEGFAKLQNAANAVGFGRIGEAVETVQYKFSAFEIMAIRTLSNIADSAYRTGTRLVKSLSVDQISAGWEKFGNKTTSVATLVSQGYELETVNEQLKRLNWFTDETSYNFTDMVSNIGKFTASGQGLEDSVTAMEGIALWAALSGQNAGTASRAMYQLSQAMGAGVMRKEDYKSIQNAAMDTDEFRQKALDAAVALGKLKKNSDGTYSSLMSSAKEAQNFTKGQFAESLTRGLWFDKDVMMDVFNEYSGAVETLYQAVQNGDYDTASEAIAGLGSQLDAFQMKAFKAGQEARTWADVVDSVKDAVSTGWMNTFEMIFGNYEEAKELWTDLANALWDVFAAGGEARNEMLEEWKELGGRDELLESFWNTFNSLVTMIETFKGAFHDIFPSIEADKLYDMTVKLADFTGGINDFFTAMEYYSSLRSEGLFSKESFDNDIDLADEALENLKKQREELYNTLEFIEPKDVKETGEALAELDSKIKSLSEHKDFYSRIDGFYSSLRGIFSLLDIGKMALETVFTLAKQAITELFPMTSGIFEAGKSFGEWATSLRDTIKESDFFGHIINTLSPHITTITTAIKTAADTIKTGLGKALEFANPLIEKAKKFLTPFVDEIKRFFGFADSITTMTNNFKEFASNPLFARTSGASSVLTTLEEMEEKAVKLGPIGTVLKTVGDTLDWFLGLFKKKDEIDETTEKVSFFTSTINFLKTVFERIKEVITGAKPLFEAIGEALKTVFDGLHSNIMNFLQNGGAKDAMGIVNGGIFGLLGMGLFNLVNDLKKRLGDFKGITGTIKEFGNSIPDVITNIMKSLKPAKENANIGDILQKVAIAIAILAGSLILLSTVPSKDLFAAVTAIGALAGVVYLLMRGLTELQSNSSNSDGIGGLAGLIFGKGKSSSKQTDIIKMSGALLMIAAGIGLLAGAVKKLAGLSWGELSRGLIAVTILIFAMVKVAESLSKMEDDLVKGAGSLILFAVGVRVLVSSVKSLAKLDSNSMGQGLVGLGVLLAELVATTKYMKEIDFGTGVAIIALATGLLIFVQSVKSLSKLGDNDLALGLFGVAIALGEVALFAKLVDGRKMLSTSTAVIALSTGLVILAKAVQIFGKTDTNELIKGIGALTVVLIEMSVFAAWTYGNNFAMLSVGMIAMSTGILILSAAFKVLSSIPLLTLFTSLAALAGVFTIFGIAATVLEPCILTLLGLGGAIVLLGVGVIALSIGLAGLGTSVVVFASAIAETIAVVIQCFVALVSGILDALNILVPKLVDVGLNIILSLLQGIMDNIGMIVASAIGIVVQFLYGIAQMLPAVIDAGVVLIIAFISGLATAISEHGEEFAKSVVELVKSLLGLVWSLLKEFLFSAIEGLGWLGEKIIGFLEMIGVINREAGDSYAESFAKSDEINTEMDKTVATIKSKEKPMNDAANAVGEAGYNGLDNWLNQYSLAGDRSGDEYIMSILNANTGSIEQLPKEAVDVLKQYGWMYEEEGKNAGEGYIRGISSTASGAAAAAAGVTRRALDEMRNTQQSQSPSKVTTRLGTYFGDGYILGIEKREDAAKKAAEDLTKGATSSMRNALSRVSDILSSDLDNTPTIRPVLDLSSINSGVGELDSMFGQRAIDLVGINTKIFDDNKLQSQLQANATSDILNGLNKLSSSMEDFISNDSSKVIEVPLSINGKEFARATATYSRDEINKLERNDLRRFGTL